MKKGMKESYIEGVANRDDPESCVGVRKDGGEALTGARIGMVLSREIKGFRMPTLLTEAEGHTDWGAIASPWRVLRGRRPLACAESSCARTGRAPDFPPQMARRDASERPEAATR